MELAEAKRLITGYKETIAILTEKLERYEAMKNESKRYVCKAGTLSVSKEFIAFLKKSMKDSGSAAVSADEVESLVHYVFSPLKEDGNIVYYTEHIARIAAFAGSARLSSGSNNEREYVSPGIGKVFYLKAKDEDVKSDEPIAVIGGFLDTREDALNWYLTQYGQKKI